MNDLGLKEFTACRFSRLHAPPVKQSQLSDSKYKSWTHSSLLMCCPKTLKNLEWWDEGLMQFEILCSNAARWHSIVPEIFNIVPSKTANRAPPKFLYKPCKQARAFDLTAHLQEDWLALVGSWVMKETHCLWQAGDVYSLATRASCSSVSEIILLVCIKNQNCVSALNLENLDCAQFGVLRYIIAPRPSFKCQGGEPIV